LSNYEEERLLLTYCLSTCVPWSFVLTRVFTFTLGNVKFDAGHIKCPRGPQVPHRCFKAKIPHLLSPREIWSQNPSWQPWDCQNKSKAPRSNQLPSTAFYLHTLVILLIARGSPVIAFPQRLVNDGTVVSFYALFLRLEVTHEFLRCCFKWLWQDLPGLLCNKLLMTTQTLSFVTKERLSLLWW